MSSSKLAMITLLLIILIGVCCADDCKPYKDFVNHTMCIYKKKACPGYKLIRSGGLTKQQRQEVVDIHNNLRHLLVEGKVNGQPKAKEMAIIYYDKELEKIAQRAADQCQFAHDQMRYVPRFKVGQNIHKVRRTPIDPDKKPNMTDAVISWWNEVSKYNFDPRNINPYKFVDGVGHYTQIAWAVTTYIGCGYSMFSDLEKTRSYKLIFCNYGPRGNVLGDPLYIIEN